MNIFDTEPTATFHLTRKILIDARCPVEMLAWFEQQHPDGQDYETVLLDAMRDGYEGFTHWAVASIGQLPRTLQGARASTTRAPWIYHYFSGVNSRPKVTPPAVCL